MILTAKMNWEQSFWLQILFHARFYKICLLTSSAFLWFFCSPFPIHYHVSVSRSEESSLGDLWLAMNDKSKVSVSEISWFFPCWAAAPGRRGEWKNLKIKVRNWLLETCTVFTRRWCLINIWGSVYSLFCWVTILKLHPSILHLEGKGGLFKNKCSYIICWGKDLALKSLLGIKMFCVCYSLHKLGCWINKFLAVN